jgi:histidyl-tRNA synthetase
MVAIIHTVFSQLQIGEYRIHVSNRKILQGLLEKEGTAGNDIFDILQTIDKIRRIGVEGVRIELLDEKQLAQPLVQRLLDLVEPADSISDALQRIEVPASGGMVREGKRELEAVFELATEAFDVPADRLTVDLSIARGLDYYTGTVYETYLLDHIELGSICSGGRYDDLASRFIERRLPGVGVSIGLSRLFAELIRLNVVSAKSTTPARILVTTLDQTYTNSYARLASHIRGQGIAAELYGAGDSLARQLRYAQRKGIPLAIIAGAKEFDQDVVKIKNLITNSEHVVTGDELSVRVREELDKIGRDHVTHWWEDAR